MKGLRVPTEDTLQLGGDVVIGPNGRIRFLYRSEGPDDRPPVPRHGGCHTLVAKSCCQQNKPGFRQQEQSWENCETHDQSDRLGIRCRTGHLACPSHGASRSERLAVPIPALPPRTDLVFRWPATDRGLLTSTRHLADPNTGPHQRWTTQDRRPVQPGPPPDLYRCARCGGRHHHPITKFCRPSCWGSHHRILLCEVQLGRRPAPSPLPRLRRLRVENTSVRTALEPEVILNIEFFSLPMTL